MAEYPKAKYHAFEPPVLVNSPAEEQALGPGWFNKPDLSDVVEEAKQEVPVGEAIGLEIPESEVQESPRGPRRR